MIPSPASEEANAALVDFRDYADDVLSSDVGTFLGNIRQFMTFQRRSDFWEHMWATHLAFIPINFPSWLQGTYNDGKLVWPQDIPGKLYIQNRLIASIADERIHIAKFGYSVFGSRSVSDAVSAFNNHVVRFYAREYLKLAADVAGILPLERIVSAPLVAPESEKTSMDIFISHSSKDDALAGALAHLLQVGLNIPNTRIRCTSVAGYKLELGAQTDAQLKAEVHESKVLIGLITPASVSSSYVLFELGARWGLGKFLGPLLAKGAPARLLPGPISGVNALRADSEDDMHQLLRDITKQLGLPAPDPSVYAKYLRGVVRLAGEADDAPVPVQSEIAPTLPKEQEVVLQALWGSDGLSYRALCELTGMSLADLKFYAGELGEPGLVNISLDSDDDVDVTITQEGRRHLKRRKLV